MRFQPIIASLCEVRKVVVPSGKLKLVATLNEAKGVVISAYQTQLEEDWLNELKAKYPVTVNEKILEKVRKCYN